MDKRLFFLINKAQHRMFKYAEPQCEQRIGLSVTQATALMFIAKNEGCLQKDLATATGMNQSAVTGLIGRMENNDLIYKKACDEDARASRLFLTEKGREKLPDVFPLVKVLNQKLTEEFSSKEIDTIARFLNHVIDDFR